MRDVLVSMEKRRSAVCGAFGMCFVGLALSSMGELTWAHYVRLFVLLPAVAVGWWRANIDVAVTMLAAALVASGAELCSPVSSGKCAVLWVGLLITAGVVAAGLSADRQTENSAIDWSVGGVAIGVLVITVAAATFHGLGELLVSFPQWGLYAAVYVVLRRCLVGASTAERRWLLIPTAIALVVVCLVGSASAGAALYELRSAKTTESDGDHATSASRFRRANELAQKIGLAPLVEQSRLGLTRSLLGLGELDAARQVLGIPADGVTKIKPDQWKGPTGALLFKNVSCWEDVWLLEGTVELEISAYSQAARGEWPRLRVELGGEVLGEVEVASTNGTTYTLSAHVATGRHRLEVSLVNGFWTSGGEHRWARLGMAHIRYRDRVR